MPDAPAAALRSRLLRWFRAGADSDPPGGDFDDLALEVFRRNFEAVPAYAGYCRARDATPGTVEDWRRIPAVPTAAFKELDLVAEDTRPHRVFRTSGTTRGEERRGRHPVADLELYRASLRATFSAFLLPDRTGDANAEAGGAAAGTRSGLRFLSLMPPADLLPDSSLAFMITDVMQRFGDAGSESYADLDGLDRPGLRRALARAEAEGAPVLILGTSAAFMHWLDGPESGELPPLAEGSRLMDTGGYKGKGRAFTAEALRDLYAHRLGLPPAACVNEYGMTEMLSQLYDTALRDAAMQEEDTRRARAPRTKRGPRWLRSVAVAPETLEPLPPGATGLLRHMDLANLDSVAAVQTEDLGRVGPDGLVLEGRAAGAPPRGCSIAMDLLLGAGG